MFETSPAVRSPFPKLWDLVDELVWVGAQGDRIVVPVGFRTDFATVPRFLHWLILPYGAYQWAAVLHDWLLHLLAEARRLGTAPAINSRDADGIFRAAMRDGGIWWATRWAMWAAVRLASLFNRDRAYGRDFAKDAPAVLGMLLLVLCTVVIPLAAVFVLVALAFLKIVKWLTGGPPPARISRRGRPAGSHPKGH